MSSSDIQVQSFNIFNSEVPTIELRSFVKPFGKTHRDLRDQFEVLIPELINSSTGEFPLSYKSYTYRNVNNREVGSYLITSLLAKAFASRLDFVKGMEYIEKLERQNHQLKLDNVLRLEAKVARQQKVIENKVQAVVPNPRARMILEKHKLLQEWVNKGWITEKVKIVNRRTYKITGVGSIFLKQVNSHIELK